MHLFEIINIIFENLYLFCARVRAFCGHKIRRQSVQHPMESKQLPRREEPVTGRHSQAVTGRRS